MDLEPITFFRKEMDAALDFLIIISKPQYLTEEGQKLVDEFLKKINLLSKEYLRQLQEEESL